MKKNPTSIRLSDEAKRLLALLAEAFGISQVAVLEILIREKAKKEGVKGPKATRREVVDP
jgi:predicted transcriptional regulator